MGADPPARNRALLTWYEHHRRELPWRETSDPWPILVSEVMAQQTQISRVVPAWERFLARYPAPADLAAGDPGELIRIWDGLGYQRRAFLLMEAAAAIAADGWPHDAAGLRRLPGVGPYTAAAVACFAFGEPAPAVDVNLRRVLSRWTGAAMGIEETRRVAAQLIDPDEPGAWNQAVMDLSAAVCRPTPRCEDCPVSGWCADPTISIAVPRQSPYEGSVRQARAAVLKRLAHHGPCGESELAGLLGLDPTRTEAAIVSLVGEGRIIRRDGGVSLADQRD